MDGVHFAIRSSVLRVYCKYADCCGESMTTALGNRFSVRAKVGTSNERDRAPCRLGSRPLFQ